MKFLVGLILFFAISGEARPLIVSDIDDTIKVSHVKDTVGMIKNAYVTTASFKGMSELYHTMLRSLFGSEIIYITNAVDYLLFESHHTFLEKNKFPEGDVYFRKKASDETHKYETLKRYLDNNQVTELILIGDNAERDIEVYSRIAREYKNKIPVIKTYIRIAYTQATEKDILSLREGQVGFVTPLEILVDLTISGLMSREEYFRLANKLALEIADAKKVDSKNPQYFPSWMSCKGFGTSVPQELMSPEISKALQKLSRLCQNRKMSCASLFR